MKEFASSAMIRALQYGLRLQGLHLNDWPVTERAHVSISDKRSVIVSIISKFGHQALFTATDGISHMPSEPLLSALLSATDIDDLLRRWQRLGRFSHSKNTTEFRWVNQNTLIIDHVSRDPVFGEHPTWFEDAVVFGVLTNLCEMLGARDLTARPVAETSGSAWRENSLWQNITPDMTLTPWRISYAQLTDSTEETREEIEHQPSISTEDRLHQLFATDPARQWSLEGSAKQLGMSKRGLQRHLRAENTSLTASLLKIRLKHATDLMNDREMSLGEIGFVCGFSDQAHFGRQFKRFAGITPAKYQKEVLNAEG